MRIPDSFRDASLLSKLQLIALLATAGATLFALLLLTALQWFLQRNELANNVRAQAAIVAINSSSALLFDDRRAAEQTLGALAAIDNIEYAEIVDKSGKDFAGYVRSGGQDAIHRHPVSEGRAAVYAINHLEVVVPIIFKQEQIGDIHVISNLAPVYDRLMWSMLVIVIAAMSAFLTAVMLLRRLLPVITDPLQYLVGLMDAVSLEKNYTLRAKLQSRDELGILAQGFNEMLTQIQIRDNTLEQHREHLEQEIAQRTADLHESNLLLEKELVERKQMELRLLESEERFRKAFQYSAIGMALVGLDGCWLKVNDALCDIVGYSEQELLGRTFQDITHPDDLQTDIGFVNRLLTGELDHYQMEKRYYHKDGHVVWIRLSVSLIRDAQDNPIYFVSQMDDITEEKLAEQEIHRLNEELESKVQERTRQLLQAQEELLRREKLAVLGQVAGSVGHELRNPLGVMNNAVYFLQTVLSDADEIVLEYLNIIKSEIASSERIVSDLLDSVRTTPPHPVMVGVRELLEQTLRKVTVPPQVTVTLDIRASLSPLLADGMQIHQVMRNLISNGIEAMPEGGTLTISADEDAQAKTITFHVRDSGIGMTPEQQSHLFQPLFTTKARGIGLGLVVVKNLTQANGGSISVQSTPGEGSVFSVTLPCKA